MPKNKKLKPISASVAESKASPGKSKRQVSLDLYNAKRHFDITVEPKGVAGRRRGRSASRFVIQQHDARRMHFDFRLELDGVLKRWAVPKGPSLSPGEKRLAVEVEDHPLDYRRFEGIIPEGQYGGGSVIVWDEGTWLPDGDAQAGLKKGHLAFQLAGQKTNGRFSLVRIKHDRFGNSKTNWLLIKTNDEFARNGAEAEITTLMPGSIVSGRTVSEIATVSAPKVWNSDEGRRGARARSTPVPTQPAGKAKKIRNTKRSKMPSLNGLSPQLATLVEAAPVSSGTIYEIKFDGYRALSRVRGGQVAIRSRNGLDWTGTFPAISSALAAIDVEAIIDGEICELDAEGRSSFQRLQQTMGTRGSRKVAADESLVYFLFDLLWLDGEDLRSQSLLERKRRLRQLLTNNTSELLVYSEHNTGDLRVSLTQACKLGLEGLIVKKADAPYEEGRSRSWLKLKCGKRQEFVIVGYLEPEGARKGFKSLMLGLHENGHLRYVGKVGTGFNDASLSSISETLNKLRTAKTAVINPPHEKGQQWVKPTLACEVSFTEMTRDGSLRHPSFKGLRKDKPAAEIVREKALEVEATSALTKSNAKPSDMGKAAKKTVYAGVAISHPDRVVDEQSRLTKAELARYFEHVSDWFLQYATDRPMALVRCPEGDARQCFFQKNAMPGLSKQVQRGTAAGHGILSIRSAAGLVELVQFNAMEFHGWGASKPSLKKPDWIIFDLDPDESLPFATVINSALEIRDALEQLGLKSFVKTTGGKGLHVTVPIRREQGWDEVKGFSKQIAEALAAQRPDRYVATMNKTKRAGRIFIDYLRNGEGSTAVLPYSSRARPNATVAVPVAWRDLKAVDPREFRVDNVAKWLGRRRSDPWKDFFSLAQSLPELKSSPGR